MSRERSLIGFPGYRNAGRTRLATLWLELSFFIGINRETMNAVEICKAVRLTGPSGSVPCNCRVREAFDCWRRLDQMSASIRTPLSAAVLPKAFCNLVWTGLNRRCAGGKAHVTGLVVLTVCGCSSCSTKAFPLCTRHVRGYPDVHLRRLHWLPSGGVT